MLNDQIDKDIVNTIKEKADYLEFYSQYTEGLRKMGKNYWARCPFHQESKPSFQINMATGMWRCWGEQIGGDIFSFYAKYFNTTRRDAIIILAETYGVKIELSQEEQEEYNRNKNLYNINKIICKKFQDNLFTPEGSTALAYLTKKRGFSLDIIKKFKIGCGISELPVDQRLIDLGLIKQYNDKYYSTFNPNRAVIPRINESGKVVAFSGRLVVENPEKSAPKYYHATSTPIYNQYEHVMGLYQAKYEIRKHQKVIIVEGELDMVRAHEKGICNTVALSGLALSVEQIALLKKYTNNFYFYIEDSATDKALPKLYEMIKKEIPYANIFVINEIGPNGEKCDLDDYLRRHSSEDFKKCISRAKTYNEYQISYLANKYDVTQPVEVNRKSIIDISSFLNTIKNPVDRKQYVEFVASKTMNSETTIYKAMKECQKKDIYFQQDKKITWLDRPVFVQRMIISTFFANFNKYNLLNYIDSLKIDSYMEPYYGNILNRLMSYVLRNIKDGEVDYNEFFTEISSKQDNILEDIINDIHMKSYELEDIPEEDLEQLLLEQIDILKEYSMDQERVVNQ